MVLYLQALHFWNLSAALMFYQNHHQVESASDKAKRIFQYHLKQGKIFN